MTPGPLPQTRFTGPLSEIRHELGLIGLALSDVPKLFRSPHRELFIRYYLLAGLNSARTVAFRAAALGTILVGYVINVVAADAQSAIHLLVQVVLREGGPLFAALMVMAQGGVEMTGQFVRMRERSEMDGLRLLGIDPLGLFCAPCLLGIAGATVVLTLYFNIIAVLGGIVLSSLISNVSVLELAGRFLAQVAMGDIFYAMLKSVLFGLCIGMTSCYHGLLGPLHQTNGGGAHLVSRSVMQTMFFLTLVNALAAYLARGVVLFGVVRL